MYADVPFLRSLRHEWESVTKIHRTLGPAFEELYDKNIFELVIDSECRPLPPTTTITKSFPVLECPKNIPLPVSILLPELLNLISQFCGPPEPETDDESSESFELPPDGSYPMPQICIKII
jgi:hypothetical protein